MTNETTQKEDEKFIDHAKSYLQYCLDFCFSSLNCLLTHVKLFINYCMIRIKIAKMYTFFAEGFGFRQIKKLNFWI